MANKVFSSYRTGKNKDAAEIQTLIVEVGDKHFACLVKSGSKEIVKDFELFKFDGVASDDFAKTFSAIVEESQLLKDSYNETQLFIHNEKSLLTPSRNFSDEILTNYLNIVHGEKYDQEIVLDRFPEAGISNISRISKGWMREISQSLQVTSVKHTYCKIIDHILQKASSFDGSLLKVCVYEHCVIVAVFKDHKVHLIQTFFIQGHDDILYHILNIAQQFHLLEEQTHFQLSGMIDAKSALFTDLEKHFERLSLEEVDTKVVQVDLSDHSKHYFTPFFNLAR